MQTETTALPGVLILTPTVFEDHRGRYIETFNLSAYDAIPNTPVIDWVQDDVSVSRQWVLRGIHGDQETWKLVSCLQGTIYLAVAIPHSKFAIGIELAGEPIYRQVLIPPGYGVGHLVVSDEAIFHYKQSTYYDPDSQFTIAWDDPALAIPWPLPAGQLPILSERDRDATAS